MLDLFTFFGRYFWLLALLITALNALFYRRRLQPYIDRFPDRAAGYRRVLIGFILLNSLIWAVMGIGIVVGKVPSVFNYLAPASGDPYILAWHALLVGIWIIGSIWIFGGGGAQFLVAHPGILRFTPTKPLYVKLFWGMFITGGIIGEIVMWSLGKNIPVP